MKQFGKALAIAGMIVAGVMAGPASADDAAMAGRIAGQWQMKDGYSDYEVTMCGPDGTSVCVKAVALRGKADTPKNRPYLNQYIVSEAKQTGANTWKGKLRLYGQTADGTILMSDDDHVTIKGCFLLLICDEFKLKRLN